MNLEFVKITDIQGTIDLDDVFEFEVPEYSDIDRIDTFVSKKLSLTQDNVPLDQMTSLWTRNNKDKLKDPNIYKQLPYGAMKVLYPNYVSSYSFKRQKQLVKLYGKKYKFLKALLTCKSAFIFFGIQEDDILFNLYLDDDHGNITPHAIFKISISSIIKMHENCEVEHLRFAFKDFIFLGITRDSYNALNLMNNVAATIHNEKKRDILNYTFQQAQMCIYFFSYFIFKLTLYKECAEINRSKKVDTINSEDTRTMMKTTEYNSIYDDEWKIIYLDNCNFILCSHEETNIHDDTTDLNSGKHHVMKHSFEVKSHKRRLKSGKVIEVSGYTKCKGLPPMKKSTLYVDGKKGEVDVKHK